jgi:hypothetical protein
MTVVIDLNWFSTHIVELWYSYVVLSYFLVGLLIRKLRRDIKYHDYKWWEHDTFKGFLTFFFATEELLSIFLFFLSPLSLFFIAVFAMIFVLWSIIVVAIQPLVWFFKNVLELDE